MEKIRHVWVFRITLAVICSIMSCEEDGIKMNPNRAIIGRWEIVEDYFGPVTKPGWYDEYFPDSVCLSYNYKDQAFYPEKYWFTDSLLTRSFVFIDPDFNDTVEIQFQYQYKFLSYNKLWLKSVDLGLNPVGIYRRIE